MVIVLGALQEALAAFSNQMKVLKMVFGVRSIRVFSKFLLDSYYEPLPWFMILKWNKASEPNISSQQETEASTYEVTELTPNTEYQFKVAAYASNDTCGSFTDIVSQFTSMYFTYTVFI